MTASLTGRYRIQGAQALAGARLWVEHVNRSGGLHIGTSSRAVPVRFSSYDDRSEPRLAASYALKLLAVDRVDVLLGPYSSGLTMAAARVADEYGALLWNHGGAADGLYERGYPGVVGVLRPASGYFAGVLELLRQVDPAARRVALLGDARRGFAGAVLSGAEAAAQRLGFEVVHQDDHGGPDAGVDGLLAVLGESHPDVILAAGELESDVRLARRLVDGYGGGYGGAKAAALVAAGVDEFRRQLGDAADGFLGPSQWEPVVDAAPEIGPTAEEFAQAFRQGGSDPAGYPAAQAYAAGLVIQQCVERAGSLEASRLRAAAAELDFTSFYGRFRIDPVSGRQIGGEPLVVQWQDGVRRVVWPAAIAQATPLYPAWEGGA